jgi:hypothetical protein
MRPHDPGITDRKKEQGEASLCEMKPGMRFAHQSSQGKVQADKVLVELPEEEGDAAFPHHFIVRLDSRLSGVSLCSPSVLVSCSHELCPFLSGPLNGVAEHPLPVYHCCAQLRSMMGKSRCEGWAASW